MLESMGYYLLFLFKIFLSLILSLIFYSIYKKDGSVSLKFYATTSIMITTLVAISYNMSIQEEHSNLILPLTILSLFIILSVFMVSKSYKEQEFLHYFLVISIATSNGLGYYFSSITLSVLIYFIHYSFDGILKFFSNNDEESFIDVDNIDSLDLKDNNELLKDEELDK